MPIGGVRVRMLLARLALTAGRPVPVEVLIDALWGADVPADAGGALQALVSRLRRALRGVGAVELAAGGYRLAAIAPTRSTGPGTEVDADELAAGATDHPPGARLGAAEPADLEVRRRTSAEFGITETTGIPANHPPNAETPPATRANRHTNTGVDTAQSAAFEVDAERFEELAARGRAELAAGQAGSAAATLGAALKLWRGPALADVLEAPFAGPAAARLAELRIGAAEDRFDAELRLGRQAEVLSELTAMVAAHPMRERLAGLRIRALAAAGRQPDALAAFEEIRARLGDELGIDPSAELREIQLALLRGELAPPPPRIAPRLPAQLTSFVGRDRELSLVTELLASSRLVTIVGPGGAGKTRLSIEAAGRYPAERVWFVPLAEAGAPDQVFDAVVGALESLSGATGPDRAPIDRLVELLDTGAALLVLDNCEHLIETAAALADRLLMRLPELKILATSREPLAVTGEALCHLESLPLPPTTAEPEQAADYPAIRLFLDRATAVRPDFRLDEHTLGPVREICAHLDGLPLALELAAAKLRSMTADQIARRLDDRFRLLTSGSRTALPRQRTLLALVEWSWDLLDDPERILAGRMSIFSGGANIEALQAVCADEKLVADDIPYVLDGLVEKSIVQVTAEPPRYRMLETVRAYAATRIGSETAELTPRFIDHMLTVAEEHEPLLRTRDQLDAMAVFDTEHENMVAALRYAEDAPTTARFMRSLFWYWGIRGMSAQFASAIADVLRLGDALPAATRAAFQVIRLMAGGPVIEPAIADPDSQRAQARSLLEEAVRAGAAAFHPTVPLWIAVQAFRTGNPDLAERQLAEALTSPDPWVRGSAHLAQDLALTEGGRQPAGAEARRAALREFEIVGDRWGSGFALLALGNDHALRGEHSAAIATFERAAAYATELGTEDDVLQSHTRLVRERLRAGDFAGAARDIDATQRLAAERGYTRVAAAILLDLAESHRRRGDSARAGQTLDRVLKSVRHLPFPEQIARDQVAAARMSLHLTEYDAAAARDLLPAATRGAFARGADAIARIAELLAGLLALENDPTGAANALGLSQIIRGAFDEGEPELRTLRSQLTENLGATGFAEAFRRGVDLPRPAALHQLAELSAPG